MEGNISEPIFNEKELKHFFSEADIHADTQADNQADIQESSQKTDAKPVEIEFQPVSQVDSTHLNIIKTILRFIVTFILIFIVSYSIINAPAIALKIKYFWETQFRNKNWSQDFKYPLAIANKSRLLIPKISTNVPIIWDVPEDQTTEKLQDGVAQYQGTAHPGEQGNIVITGHSSYYIWAPGSYKSVFALLSQLSAGDKIYIQYNQAQFAYVVTNKKVVDPDDLSALEETSDQQLTLITCVPIGTTLQRLIITAKQVAS